MWFISFYLTDQSGSGITLDSVTKILTKRRSLYIFDWLTVNTELTLTSSPFSRPIRSDKTKRQLLVIATDLVVHEEENTRNSSGRTFILHSFHYQSQSSEKRRFWLDPPPFLLHTTPQYHRGEEDNSGRAGAVYSASYC